LYDEVSSRQIKKRKAASINDLPPLGGQKFIAEAVFRLAQGSKPQQKRGLPAMANNPFLYFTDWG